MAAEKPSSLAPILRMEDVLEMDSMLTPEGPAARRKSYHSDEELSERNRGDNEMKTKRRRQDTSGERRSRRLSKVGGSEEALHVKRRPADDSEEELPGLAASAEVESQGSGSKRVQIVVDRYYRRRSADWKMCKCYNRDLSAGSRGSRGYTRRKSPDSR